MTERWLSCDERWSRGAPCPVACRTGTFVRYTAGNSPRLHNLLGSDNFHLSDPRISQPCGGFQGMIGSGYLVREHTRVATEGIFPNGRGGGRADSRRRGG